MDKDMSATIVSIILIFLAALLTALNLFNRIGKLAGAGSLIPITGFANAIVSPAIEYKSEGYVMGVGSKMFTVAGPVLVFRNIRFYYNRHAIFYFWRTYCYFGLALRVLMYNVVPTKQGFGVNV